MKLDANRILKNTIALYLRMGVMMLVTLYTSRVVLKALGVDDFGIYNIVGGVAVFLGFLYTSVVSATQRFLNFELENGSTQNLQRLFSMCVNIHAIIAGVILIVGEIVGVIVLNFYLNIPDGKMYAANWVYQFSLLSFCITILRAPYEAATIAKEQMEAFAYLSIFDVIARLIIAISLCYISFDKLIYYGVWIFLSTFLSCIVFAVYTLIAFDFTKYIVFWEHTICKKILNFSIWSTAGSISDVINKQGTNIALNIFNGVTVNAAMGIAEQVSTAVSRLTGNFQTAFAPQITKLYASKNIEDLHRLIKISAKVSFLLSMFIAIPIIVNCDFILTCWLGNYPQWAPGFAIILTIQNIVWAINTPLRIAVNATGNITVYQTVYCASNILGLLATILLLHYGFDPIISTSPKIIMIILFTIWGAIFIAPRIQISRWDYLYKIILKLFMIGILSIGIPCFGLAYTKYNTYYSLSWTVIGIFITIISVILYTLDETELNSIKKFIRNRMK